MPESLKRPAPMVVPPFDAESPIETRGATDAARAVEALRAVAPGAELRRLEHLFVGRLVWDGQAVSDVGVPTPLAFHVIGSGVSRLTPDGLWVEWEADEELYLEGVPVAERRSHWTLGWDSSRHEYVAAEATSSGRMEWFHGEFRHGVLTLEAEATLPARTRVVLDFTDPRAVRIRRERALDRHEWATLESVACTRLGSPSCVATDDPLLPW